MKKYRYTHHDGTQEIVTARFTQKEIMMIHYAVGIAFDDVAMNEDNEKLESDELRKALYVIKAKCTLKGWTNKKADKFFDDYIPM
jgi:hypothetical protein